MAGWNGDDYYCQYCGINNTWLTMESSHCTIIMVNTSHHNYGQHPTNLHVSFPMFTPFFMLPSGELTKSYGKWPSRNSGFSHEKWWIFPWQNVSSPEGMFSHHDRFTVTVFDKNEAESSAAAPSPARMIPSKCCGPPRRATVKPVKPVISW